MKTIIIFIFIMAGVSYNTSQRSEILSVLKKLKHFSAIELYQELQKKNKQIGLATVYRTLKFFSCNGVLKQQDFCGAETRYEVLKEQEHHDHLICKKCGKIEEFKNVNIEKLQNKIAEKYSFKLHNHRLDLFGICKKCS